MAPAVSALLSLSSDVVNQILHRLNSDGRRQMLCVSRAMRDAVQESFPRTRIQANELDSQLEIDTLVRHLAARKGATVKELELGSRIASSSTILASLGRMVAPYQGTLARLKLYIPEMEATDIVLLSCVLVGYSELEEVVLEGKKLNMVQRLWVDRQAGVQETKHVAMFPFAKLVFDFPLISRSQDSTLSICTMGSWGDILTQEAPPPSAASAPAKLEFFVKQAMQSEAHGVEARRCVFPSELIPGVSNLRTCHFVGDFATRYLRSETLQELVIKLPVRGKDVSLRVPSLRVLDCAGGAGLFLKAHSLEEVTVRGPMGFLGGLEGCSLKKLVLGKSDTLWSCTDMLKILLCVPSVETTELLTRVVSEPGKSFLSSLRVFSLRHAVKHLVFGESVVDIMMGEFNAGYGTRVRFQEALSLSSLRSVVLNMEYTGRISEFLLAVRDVVQKLTVVKHGSKLDLNELDRLRKVFKRISTQVEACQRCLIEKSCC
ncbi:hypothetical protein KFL_006570040 [Klebsormidium nitens]|uniref:F-box domain-containing protein n=1 Tax=Klebsormidium nitens TaxID=105231 RepID=A0A1Y1IM98_KLENI|nr:hypothetical protein KFL_006570040 [Klebsormidium nitens]|eukprot:GAQ90569.1 hypothetical protein KFL_006570040 [Klebsormidium nitens]